VAEQVRVVCGLDQAPKFTGWAIGTPDRSRKLAYGLFRQESWRNCEGQRGVEFSRWFVDLLRQHGVTDVFFEDYVSTNRHEKDQDIDFQQKMQAGLVCVCAKSVTGREPKVVSPSSMRERFIGTAKAPPTAPQKLTAEWLKNAAIRRCQAEGYHDVFDHNVAEGIGHCYYGMAVIDPAFAAHSDVAMRRLDLIHTRNVFFGNV
jgi:hypothetical protein